jgi:hypothetical protein
MRADFQVLLSEVKVLQTGLRIIQKEMRDELMVVTEIKTLNRTKLNQADFQVLVSEFKTLNRTKVNQADIRDLQSDIKNIQKELAGNFSNVARSNEMEVIESVHCFLTEAGCQDVTAPMRNQVVFENGSKLCELDGLIQFQDSFAVIEVKSKVTMDALYQLERAMHIVKGKYGGEVIGFLGGPIVDLAVKQEALERGVLVVEVSGDRYRVVEAEPERFTASNV